MATLSYLLFGHNARGVKLPISSTPIAYADRPAAPYVGQLINFSDSNTVTWGATVGGSSTNSVLARWNGTNWTVVGV